MKIYLSGPMRDIPDLNFPAFHEAAAKLRADGHFVFNPAESDVDQNDLRMCFQQDTYYICTFADVVALLPGWEKSKGARAEKALAEAIGLGVMEL